MNRRLSSRKSSLKLRRKSSWEFVRNSTSYNSVQSHGVDAYTVNTFQVKNNEFLLATSLDHARITRYMREDSH